MALGSLNLKVSKKDFEDRILIVEGRMNTLMDVIERYNFAKEVLDQFIESGDSNYKNMIARVDANILAAKKACDALCAALDAIKATMQFQEEFLEESLTIYLFPCLQRNSLLCHMPAASMPLPLIKK